MTPLPWFFEARSDACLVTLALCQRSGVSMAAEAILSTEKSLSTSSLGLGRRGSWSAAHPAARQLKSLASKAG